MPTVESICDSPGAHEIAVNRFKHEAGITHVVGVPMARRWPWTLVLKLSMFIAVPATLILLAAYSADRRSHPTDEELTASFLAHESDFQTLTLMLDASYLITGDRPIKGRWFIHHDMTVAVAFAPY